MAREPYGRDIYDQGQQRPTGPGTDPTIRVGGAVDVSNLAGLVEVPQLDARGPAAYGAGLSALGEGVGQVGGSLLKLSEMAGRALQITQTTEAEREMAGLSSEIEIAQANERDPSKWGAIANDILAKLPPLREDLSPDARDHIESRRVAWQQGVVQNTALRSTKQLMQNADADLNMLRKAASAEGNVEEANRLAQEQENLGTQPKGFGRVAAVEHQQDADRLMRKKEAARERTVTEAATNLAMVDPKMAMETVYHPDFGKNQNLSPTAVMSARNTVRATINFNKGQSIDSTMNRIWSDTAEDKITTEAEIDALTDPNLDEADRKKMKAEIKHRSDAETKAWYNTNAPRIAADLSVSIESYDVKEDEAVNEGLHERAMRLRQHIARLPQGMRSHLSQMLQNREFPGAASPDNTVFSMGDTELKRSMKAEEVGSVTGVVEEDEEAPKQDTPEKAQARLQRMRRYSKAREEWRQWVEKHPESTTFEGDALTTFQKIQGTYFLDTVHAAPVPTSPPVLQPTGVDSGVSDDVNNILLRHGAPASTQKSTPETPAVKKKSGFIEPPIPGQEFSQGSSEPSNELIALPPPEEEVVHAPYPGFAGEGMVPLDSKRIKQIKDRRLESYNVFDQKERVWKQVEVSALEGHSEYLVTP